MVPSFACRMSSLTCSIRRAIPYPCSGPRTSSVLSTIRSRVPRKISLLGSTAAPLAIPEEYGGRPFRCQEECGSFEPTEIVGVVADMRQGLEGDLVPGMFRPCFQTPAASAMLAVRTKGDPLRFINAVRHQVLAIDRDQA